MTFHFLFAKFAVAVIVFAILSRQLAYILFVYDSHRTNQNRLKSAMGMPQDSRPIGAKKNSETTIFTRRVAPGLFDLCGSF